MISFAALLRRSMTLRGVNNIEVGKLVGVRSENVSCWRTGKKEPTIANAQKLAEALMEPRLFEMLRDQRSGNCEVCQAPFVSAEQGQGRRYCSRRCVNTGHHRREKKGRSLDGVISRRRLTMYQEAVAAFCWDCEAGGLCRTPECALRGVSPLPLGAAA